LPQNRTSLHTVPILERGLFRFDFLLQTCLFRLCKYFAFYCFIFWFEIFRPGLASKSLCKATRLFPLCSRVNLFPVIGVHLACTSISGRSGVDSSAVSLIQGQPCWRSRSRSATVTARCTIGSETACRRATAHGAACSATTSPSLLRRCKKFPHSPLLKLLTSLLATKVRSRVQCSNLSGLNLEGEISLAIGSLNSILSMYDSALFPDMNGNVSAIELCFTF
jgi:hypothetical protein